MELLWYYTRGGQTSGPFPFADLKKLVAGGELLPQDSVRQEGTSDWLPANQVPNLFAPAPPPVAPIPLTEAAPLPEPELLLEIDDSPEPAKKDEEQKKKRYRDDEDWDGRPERGKKATDEALKVLGRAFTSDLQSIQPTEDEGKDLRREGLKGRTLQNYSAWRHSVLWVIVVPGFLAALFNLIGSFSTEGLSGFGVLMAFLNVLATIALPVTALIAAVNYAKPRMSSRVLLLGGAIAYAVPLLTAIFPIDWLVDSKATSVKGSFGLTFKVLLTLSFALVAVLAGLSRSSIRLKGLVPKAILPGWALVFSAPLFVLMGFASFLSIYHLANNVLLNLGIVLWIGSPLIYLWRSDLLIRPLVQKKEFKALAQLQLFVLISASVGILFIVIALFAGKIAESSVTVLGFEKNDSLIRPWNLHLHSIWLEYVTRSLFLTVLFADLLLRVNLSIWKREKEFAGTEHAADHEGDMADFAASLQPPPSKAKHDDEDDDDRPKRRERDRDDERD